MPRKYTYATIRRTYGKLSIARKALGIPYPEHPRNRQLAMAR